MERSSLPCYTFTDARVRVEASPAVGSAVVAVSRIGKAGLPVELDAGCVPATLFAYADENGRTVSHVGSAHARIDKEGRETLVLVRLDDDAFRLLRYVAFEVLRVAGFPVGTHAVASLFASLLGRLRRRNGLAWEKSDDGSVYINLTPGVDEWTRPFGATEKLAALDLPNDVVRTGVVADREVNGDLRVEDLAMAVAAEVLCGRDVDASFMGMLRRPSTAAYSKLPETENLSAAAWMATMSPTHVPTLAAVDLATRGEVALHAAAAAAASGRAPAEACRQVVCAELQAAADRARSSIDLHLPCLSARDALLAYALFRNFSAHPRSSDSCVRPVLCKAYAALLTMRAVVRADRGVYNYGCWIGQSENVWMPLTWLSKTPEKYVGGVNEILRLVKA